MTPATLLLTFIAYTWGWLNGYREGKTLGEIKGSAKMLTAIMGGKYAANT